MATPVARADLSPLTPRLIGEDVAAAYLGIGKTGFRVRWKDKRELPQPVKIGERLLWDVHILDRYVDALSGIGAPLNSWGD